MTQIRVSPEPNIHHTLSRYRLVPLCSFDFRPLDFVDCNMFVKFSFPILLKSVRPFYFCQFVPLCTLVALVFHTCTLFLFADYCRASFTLHCQWRGRPDLVGHLALPGKFSFVDCGYSCCCLGFWRWLLCLGPTNFLAAAFLPAAARCLPYALAVDGTPGIFHVLWSALPTSLLRSFF